MARPCSAAGWDVTRSQSAMSRVIRACSEITFCAVDVYERVQMGWLLVRSTRRTSNWRLVQSSSPGVTSPCTARLARTSCAAACAPFP